MKNINHALCILIFFVSNVSILNAQQISISKEIIEEKRNEILCSYSRTRTNNIFYC